MVSDWNKYRLGDLISIKHGYAYKGSDFSENISEGPIVVTIGNFDYSGGFRFESTRIKRTLLAEPEDYILSPGDILLVMTCQTPGGEILGIPGIIPENSETYLHNQRLGKVEFKNEALDKGYAYWLFMSGDFNRHLYVTATGTKILHTAPKRIESYDFLLPPLAEQKAIAHILGSLDDKIELNRQMSETLKAMAQSLFKSWFVDFDPVIDNALLAGNDIPDELEERAERRQAQLDSSKSNTNSQINDLFPSEFEFTEELGWIPKGWSLGKFSDLAKLNPESWSKKNIPDEILYVDLGNTNNGKIDSVTSYLSSDAPSRAKRVLAVDDTIIGTVRPGNRSFAYIHNEGLTGSTGFAVMRPLEPKNRSYIYFGLTQDKVIDYFSNMASGSAYPAINSNVVADLACVIPPENILAYFDNKAYTFINKIGVNNNLNETLAKLRDTLLPKLISGELRIPDADKLVEDI